MWYVYHYSAEITYTNAKLSGISKQNYVIDSTDSYLDFKENILKEYIRTNSIPYELGTNHVHVTSLTLLHTIVG